MSGKGVYSSIPDEKVAIDVATTYFQNNLPAALEFSKEKLRDLQKYANDGHWTWRASSLVAGALIVSVNLLAFLSNLFGLQPLIAVLNLYLIAFGILMITLECKEKVFTSKYLQIIRKEVFLLLII